jgi:hypothetical protein
MATETEAVTKSVVSDLHGVLNNSGQETDTKTGENVTGRGETNSQDQVAKTSSEKSESRATVNADGEKQPDGTGGELGDDNSSSEEEAEEDRRDASGKPEDEDDNVQDVTYSLEYRDALGFLVAVQPWKQPFNLEQARNDALPKKTAVFKVTTVLDTTIPSDRFRSSYDRDRIFKEEGGILKNPDVSISIKTTTLRLFSRSVIQTLRKVISYYPDISLYGDTVLFQAPYCPLVHYLEDLEKYRGPAENQQPENSTGSSLIADDGTRHMGLLVDYLRTMYGDRIEDEKNRHQRGFCTFSLVWILFKPGTTVYVRSEGRLSARVVENVVVDPKIVDSTDHACSHIKVAMWCLDYDGRKIGRYSSTEYLSHFDGEARIESLNIFPCQFLDKDDNGAARHQLVERGKRWFSLLNGGMVDHEGQFLDGHKNEVRPAGRSAFQLYFPAN